MTERIDHVAEAVGLREIAATPGIDVASATSLVTAAQVHATLALVEQQRIANLVALIRIETENDSTPTDALDAVYLRESTPQGVRLRTRPEIAAALGITDDEEERS